MVGRGFGKAAIAAAFVAMAVCLAGCSSVSDSLDQAIGEAVAATATAKLTTSLHLDGKATVAYLATTYDDALTQLQGADSTVSSLAASPGEAVHRHDVQSAIRRATDAVVTAQEDLNAGATLSPDLRALGSALRALKAESSS